MSDVVVGPADAKARRLAALRDAQNAALASGRWQRIDVIGREQPDFIWLPDTPSAAGLGSAIAAFQAIGVSAAEADAALRRAFGG